MGQVKSLAFFPHQTHERKTETPKLNLLIKKQNSKTDIEKVKNLKN